MYNKSSLKSGFTLIELSIVLVIIGLLVGGVVTGSSLIHQSSLKSVINEFNTINTAINSFKLQYNFLPGDFPNAGSFWSGSSNCANSASPTGCNGDGNGQVYFVSTSGTESYRAFQHMNLAGILDGSFPGDNTFSSLYPSKYKRGYYDIRYGGTSSSGPIGNQIELGNWSIPGRIAAAGLAQPYDAYNIDSKMDDGLPNTGKLIGFDGANNTAGACATTSYNLTGTVNGCRMSKILD
jgi:prepilin-type N-terminal cleavage/methylation domain-containing protein